MAARSLTYRRRLLDRRLTGVLAEFPAVLINGPRAVGKTTTARQVARDMVKLDEPAQAAVFRADPDAALRTREEPLLLDEWQEVPTVLGAVRRAVDDDPHPGRFILTGSVRAELEQAVWPGTGRLIRLSMYGVSEVEAVGRVGERPGFLDRLTTSDPTAFVLPPTRPRLPDYVEIALRSGFPELVFRDRAPAARQEWLDSYVDQLLTRDALALEPRRDVQRLRRYFEALALNTAGMPLDRTLFDTAGINHRTAAAYDRLLENLFIAEQVPAWTTDRLSRLVHASKRYIVDPALAASAAGVDAAAILRDGDLVGRILDTFAVAQLRVEVALALPRPRLHHLRTKNGRQEIDVLVELRGGGVVALEVKATAAPSSGDARHLAWARDALGERFVVGVVLHTGPDIVHLDDRIFAIPLCAMWG